MVWNINYNHNVILLTKKTYSRKYDVVDNNETNKSPPPFASIEISTSPKKDSSMEISDDRETCDDSLSRELYL